MGLTVCGSSRVAKARGCKGRAYVWAMRITNIICEVEN
jgi:hypothetical protein